MTTLKLFVSAILFLAACSGASLPAEKPAKTSAHEKKPLTIKMGAERPEKYLPLLQGQSVGLVANQTATLRKKADTIHLADFLLQKHVALKTIFSPEHGFRGKADAGAKVQDGKDPVTGLPVISLYGKNRKPQAAQLANIDVLLFDIQDVGARFYTYISTLHYVMEACAENHIPLIILDRPNPNGHYVDGPILTPEFQSFVGMHPVPIVHGMTIGEYGQMINGEGWLKDGIKADLTVIPCGNYTHQTPYALPIKPSPNLPNERSVLLYPSLCLFEGTVVSIGRGTHHQFQLIGHPALPKVDTTFIPRPLPGALHPKLEGKPCNGWNLSNLSPEEIRQQKKLNLDYLVRAYAAFPDKKQFFLKNHFFDKLAGSDVLRKQIIQSLSAKEIRQSWQKDLENFKMTRNKYLIYPQ